MTAGGRRAVSRSRVAPRRDVADRWCRAAASLAVAAAPALRALLDHACDARSAVR